MSAWEISYELPDGRLKKYQVQAARMDIIDGALIFREAVQINGHAMTDGTIKYVAAASTWSNCTLLDSK